MVQRKGGKVEKGIKKKIKMHKEKRKRMIKEKEGQGNRYDKQTICKI